MGRLIDADELEKVMTEDWYLEMLAWNNSKDGIKKRLKECIAEQPTAYVIDNVIQEIDDDIAYIETDDTKEKFVHYESVVSAIRKGGLEYE